MNTSAPKYFTIGPVPNQDSTKSPRRPESPKKSESSESSESSEVEDRKSYLRSDSFKDRYDSPARKISLGRDKSIDLQKPKPDSKFELKLDPKPKLETKSKLDPKPDPKRLTSRSKSQDGSSDKLNPGFHSMYMLNFLFLSKN